jgi:hypothetical protein
VSIEEPAGFLPSYIPPLFKDIYGIYVHTRSGDIYMRYCHQS